MDIRELIAVLDGDDWNAGEQALAELESLGPDVLEPLMEAAPRFQRFGQLCAIQLFEHISDARAGAVLIPMLRDDDEAVRTWAARALGGLDVREATPELRRAYEAVRVRGTPLDWSEPDALRDALRDLGAREEVIPDGVAELAVSERMITRGWPVEHLPEVIAELADARQLVLYFMFWTRWRDTHRWQDSPSWELDWSLPWDALVEAARRDALAAAREAGTPADTIATVTWLDESDR